MASIISANIDLTKIEKGKIYEGKKGKYYPITIVLNDEPGQYGDSGYIQTEQTKEGSTHAACQRTYRFSDLNVGHHRHHPCDWFYPGRDYCLGL